MLNKKRERKTFNEKMNPKNFYFKNSPDFKILSEEFPAFSKFVFKNSYGNYSINWKNKNAVKELCRTLLKHDFKIDYWDIPEGFLIPSITSRCNYICWIHDLLQESELLNSKIKIKGLDIGTGANIIYPLLGYKIYSWEFKCSDVNPEAIKIAKENIVKNKLQDKILIIHQKEMKNIFKNVIDSNFDRLFHFSMCNPPYFSLEDEMKSDNPNTVMRFHLIFRYVNIMN
jgi:23S rRNA (adenine1618-N6)-methyltransferase